ncbi:hypothetical protein L9F63_011214, partial [Diploptera punctata]
YANKVECYLTFGHDFYKIGRRGFYLCLFFWRSGRFLQTTFVLYGSVLRRIGAIFAVVRFRRLFGVVRFGSCSPIQASTTLHVAQPWFSSCLLRCSGDDMVSSESSFPCRCQRSRSCEVDLVIPLFHMLHQLRKIILALAKMTLRKMIVSIVMTLQKEAGLDVLLVFSRLTTLVLESIVMMMMPL